MRAAIIAAVTAVATLVILSTTDGGAPWSQRLAMWAALAPVAGAVGVQGAIRMAEARGELRALSAVGAAPARIVAGAVCGGIAVALIGACLAASGWADLEVLFPRPAVARLWAAEGDRGMREMTLGLRIAAGGAFSVTAPFAVEPAGSLSRETFAAAVAALVASAVILPAWAALEGPLWRRALAFGVTIVALIVAFQVVAAGRISSAVLLLPPLLPLVELCVAWYRRLRGS